MIRTIKFRGKRVDNGEWVYGYYMLGLNAESYIIHWIKTSPTSTENVYTIVDSETVGQYVGFNDRNNVEVYEDDYIKGYESTENLGFKTTNLKVVFEDSAFCANGVTGEGDCFLYFFSGNPTQIPEACCEVIGNVHDHPTLFKNTNNEK